MTLVPEIADMEMPVEGVFHNLVIARIQKSYAGQGQKVMNAMWGAGQMMFNKILVLTGSPDPAELDAATEVQPPVSGSFPLSDYRELARDVFRNLNAATDIYFSQGPMDVLDHSCSKLGFGGKMCIDGSRKFEEEKDDQKIDHADTTKEQNGMEAALKSAYAEVKAVNTALLADQIPCIIISVE